MIGLREAIKKESDVLADHEVEKIARAIEDLLPEPDDIPETILQKADAIVNGSRSDEYGPPEFNFNQIATAWSVYLASAMRFPEYEGDEKKIVSPHDVCMLMIILKAMRVSSGYHEDSIMDIGGYVAIAEKVKP